MKKLLLMLVACIAAVNVSAQDDEGWSKSFAPVADKADLDGLHTAVAADGSVFVSSTYNQAFQLGDLSVAAPEDAVTSSVVVKMDKDGVAKWAVTFYGKCKIYAMTADTDGTLYVAGRSQDAKVVATGVDGKHYEIVNPTGLDAFFEEVIKANVAFIAKIGQDGVIQVVKTIQPEVNAAIAAIVGDPYEMGMEMSIYDLSANDPCSVIPSKLVIDGDKLYVAATYTGDVPALGWKGAYLNYYGMDMMIFDVRSVGVFSLNKSDLDNPASAAYIMATETVQTMSQFYPEAVDFVVYGGVPHVAFFGFGNLTMTTAAGSQDFSFAVGEEDTEHALVLANVNAPQQPKVFHAAANTNVYPIYNLDDAALAGDNCIMAGTFYGNFPLDNTVTKEHNASFVASIKMSDCSVNWAKANEKESEAKCMVVTGEEIHASTADALYTFRTSDGDLKQTQNQGYADAAQCNDQYVSTVRADENNVVVFCPKLKTSGINETEALNSAAARYYNLNGVELSAPQKGLNIVKTTNGQTQKRVVR